MEASNFKCSRACWLQVSRFFAMLVLTGLFSFSSFAETVPMVEAYVPSYFMYKIGPITFNGGSPECNGSVVTAEFPTRAEALAALLTQQVQLNGCGGWPTYYYYFKADPDPVYYQIWMYVSDGKNTTNFRTATWPIPPIYYPSVLKKQCPTPTTWPEVPYTPDTNGLTCTRPDETCPIPPLTPLDTSVQPYEDGLVDMDNETQATRDGTACIVKEARTRRIYPKIVSGYRPPAYQTHIREVYDKWLLLENNNDSACADTKRQVEFEFKKHSKFSHQPGNTSRHSSGLAVDIHLLNYTDADIIAAGCTIVGGGTMSRPVPNDRSHFESPR